MLARKDIVIKPVRPSPGLQALYRKRLKSLVEDMARSVEYWLTAAYRANKPKIVKLAGDETAARRWRLAYDALSGAGAEDIAMDALPADALQKMMRELRRRWTKRFDDGAKELARHFAKAASKRSDKRLQQILKDAGFSVEFRMTAAQRDVVNAIVHENVSLIKSIPEQYLKNVEGTVMRAVQKGYDVGGLKKELKKQYGVTERRARLISHDQNSKANAMLNRTRQMELGATKAIWRHSHAGKTPRPTHVANDGKVYDITKGWYDPDAHGKGKGDWIQPGELINCRCFSTTIIPGMG